MMGTGRMLPTTQTKMEGRVGRSMATAAGTPPRSSISGTMETRKIKRYFFSICDNPFEKINLELKATQYNKKGLRNYVNLNVDAKENQVNTRINWANNKQRLFKADLSASTLFIEEKQETGKPKLRTEITIDECPLILNDSTWHIAPARVAIADNKINIHNFSISNRDKQHLYLDGTISKEPTDTLLLDLKQIELKN